MATVYVILCVLLVRAWHTQARGFHFKLHIIISSMITLFADCFDFPCRTLVKTACGWIPENFPQLITKIDGPSGYCTLEVTANRGSPEASFLHKPALVQRVARRLQWDMELARRGTAWNCAAAICSQVGNSKCRPRCSLVQVQQLASRFPTISNIELDKSRG